MAQIFVRDVPPDVIARLKKRAAANRRSLQQEVKVVLEEAASAAEKDAERARRMEEFRAFAEALTNKVRAEGRPQSDSTEYIRAFREGNREDD
jgi:plasmid stability protein